MSKDKKIDLRKSIFIHIIVFITIYISSFILTDLNSPNKSTNTDEHIDTTPINIYDYSDFITMQEQQEKDKNDRLRKADEEKAKIKENELKIEKELVAKRKLEIKNEKLKKAEAKRLFDGAIKASELEEKIRLEIKNEKLKKVEAKKLVDETIKASKLEEKIKNNLDDIRVKKSISNDLIKYKGLLNSTIKINWKRPKIPYNISCTAKIHQDSRGNVINIDIPDCNNITLSSSIKASILNSSPLPLPTNKENFNSHIEINFTINY